MYVPTQFPARPDQQELLPVGSEVSDLFIWPLWVRLMHPITSGHSLFSSCSPAAKWMIKLERGTGRFCWVSGKTVSHCSHGASCLSFLIGLSIIARVGNGNNCNIHVHKIFVIWLLSLLPLPSAEVSVTWCWSVCGYCLIFSKWNMPKGNVRARGERKTSLTKTVNQANHFQQ